MHFCAFTFLFFKDFIALEILLYCRSLLFVGCRVMAVISVKEVSKSFGKKKVLDNVSFDIEEGEIFGLLGSNGAGKSTLTSIILGLEKSSSGEVYFFDKKKMSSVRKEIGFVPQEVAFYKDFTVEANMNFFAGIYGLKKGAAKKRIAYLLDWLAIKEYSKTKADLLSGGYQRLLNIAIALLHDPKILFLDEPTVGLDPNMRKLFWEKILALKDSGKTIIITTHYMDEAERLCSRVALMKKGKLLVIGKPVELIKKYGGIKVMILEVSEAVKEEDISRIKIVLKQSMVLARGKLLFIPLEQEHGLEKMLAVVQLLMGQGYNITSSTMKEPSLEEVFLNLTGEKMKAD